MVLLYMVTFTINIPQMLVYIYIYHTWILWVLSLRIHWINGLVGSWNLLSVELWSSIVTAGSRSRPQPTWGRRNMTRKITGFKHVAENPWCLSRVFSHLMCYLVLQFFQHLSSPWRIHGAAIYMVTFTINIPSIYHQYTINIPSIYTIYVSINIPAPAGSVMGSMMFHKKPPRPAERWCILLSLPSSDRAGARHSETQERCGFAEQIRLFDVEGKHNKRSPSHHFLVGM